MPDEMTSAELEQIKLAACRKYIAAGWVVHPLSKPDDKGNSPGKRPLISGWQDLTATPEDIGGYIRQGCNLGLVCGKVSNVTAIDLDDDLFIPELLNGVQVHTLMSSRTNRRGHLYFRYNPTLPASKNHELGFEVMSDGNNLVMPPSVHKSRDVYRWGCEDKTYSLDEIDEHLANLPEMPQQLVDNINALIDTHAGLKASLAKSRHCFRDVIKRKPDMHGADGREYMLAVCTDLKAAGATEEHIKIFAKLMYGKGYDEARTLQEWRNIDPEKTWQCETIKAKLPAYISVEECDKCEQRRQDRRNGELKGNCACVPYHKTDLGNGRRLADMFKADIRYSHSWKSWLVWDSKRWAVDDVESLRGYARRVVSEIYEEAGIEDDFEERKRLLLFALKSESASSIKNMIELAQSEEGIPIRPAVFDKDPWLFNVQNGTLDLRTGVLRLHDKNDLITKISPIIYDPVAACPVWIGFLNSIFNNNQNIIEYIQRKCGYILTGVTREEDLDILYGIGGNGKSKLTGALIYVMGDYQTKANIETIQATKQQSGSCASSDVACLKGARLVTVSEPEKGTHLNESRVKDLTGRDPIKARQLYQEPFEFMPEFKLWLYTNFKPIIKGQDRGIWRRIKLIPFDVCIPEEQQDKELDIKLQAEAAGILNWCLEGCLKWQKDGLKVPDEILQATAEYKNDMDVFGEFFEDCCTLEKGAVEYSIHLYTIYKVWCGIQDYNPYSLKKFISNLEERGYKRLPKTMKGVSFSGLKLQRHIYEAYEEMKTIHSGFNYDAVTQMTQFLETLLYSPSRGELYETASSASFVSTVAQSASCSMTEKTNNDANDAKSAKDGKIEIKDKNQVTHLTKIIIDAGQDYAKLKGIVNSSNVASFSLWIVEKYKPQWQMNGESGYYTPSAIKALAMKILKITPEPAAQTTTTPGA